MITLANLAASEVAAFLSPSHPKTGSLLGSDSYVERPVLSKALRRRDRGKGGRQGFDPVLKFKMLVLQALHGLSLSQTSYETCARIYVDGGGSS